MHLKHELERDGAIFHSTSDSEIILHLISRSRRQTLQEAFVVASPDRPGCLFARLMTPEYLLAARDPHGFRPCGLGRLGGSYVVASETCAFDLINAEYVSEMEPGEIIRIEGNSLESQSAADQRKIRPLCV